MVLLQSWYLLVTYNITKHLILAMTPLLVIYYGFRSNKVSLNHLKLLNQVRVANWLIPFRIPSPV